MIRLLRPMEEWKDRSNGDGLILVLGSRTEESVRESPITRDWTGREEPKLAENKSEPISECSYGTHSGYRFV